MKTLIDRLRAGHTLTDMQDILERSIAVFPDVLEALGKKNEMHV